MRWQMAVMEGQTRTERQKVTVPPSLAVIQPFCKPADRQLPCLILLTDLDSERLGGVCSPIVYDGVITLQKSQVPAVLLNTL